MQVINALIFKMEVKFLLPHGDVEQLKKIMCTKYYDSQIMLCKKYANHQGSHVFVQGMGMKGDTENTKPLVAVRCRVLSP